MRIFGEISKDHGMYALIAPQETEHMVIDGDAHARAGTKLLTTGNVI